MDWLTSNHAELVCFILSPGVITRSVRSRTRATCTAHSGGHAKSREHPAHHHKPNREDTERHQHLDPAFHRTLWSDRRNVIEFYCVTNQLYYQLAI